MMNRFMLVNGDRSPAAAGRSGSAGSAGGDPSGSELSEGRPFGTGERGLRGMAATERERKIRKG
jgi:hypothetical protein